MPSIDTIRTVTVRGKADGVDQATAALNQLTDSIKAANDNLSKSAAASQASSEGFNSTGLSVATAANHLRQAAEAAYAFSPAFRGVVNEMATPALSAASTAIGAVAAGIVTATNYAGTGLIALAGAAEKVNPNFLALTSTVRTAGLAMEGFSPTVATAGASILGMAGTIVSRFLPVVGQILLVYDAIKMVAQAWELGGQKLAEYVAISEKAVASNVSTEFFQRITKGAEDAGIKVDGVTAALKNLNAATVDRLGGSTGQVRLDQLLQAGNFKGNTGVAELGQANTTEERLRAIRDLIDQAMDKGQRLAALDVAKTFLGDEVAANLAKDSEYLDKLLDSADEVSKKDLIPQEQIDHAVELQNRLDAAEKILSQRWHPIQDLLTDLGIKMRDVWVSIVEAVAKVVDLMFTLAQKVVDFLTPMLGFLARAEQVAARVGITAVPLVGPAIAAGYDAYNYFNGQQPGSGSDAALAAAKARLASQMSNPANVKAAGTLDVALQSRVRGDTSFDPNAKTPDTSAYDRAEESVLKYIEVTKAATLTVTDAAGEQERFKVVAQLTAAAMKDGLSPEAAKAKAEMSGLGNQAAVAADALAKAKLASQIDFSNKTAFLTPQDLQIAQQLRGIYGNDIPTALASTEAAALRAADGLRQISSIGQDVNRSFLVDFETGLRNGTNAWKSFETAGLNALGKIADKLASMAADNLWKAAFPSGGSGILGLLGIGGSAGAGAGAAATSTGAAGVGGLGGLYHTGGIIGSEPTSVRYIHPAYFDDAPRFHDGGIAGDEVPIIAKKGEGVFTPGQMAALGAANSGPNITYAPNIDARGADAQTVARLAAALAEDRKNFERNVKGIVARARQNNPGAF